MEYSFPRYLLSKQTVDDRAINRTVYDALQANLPAGLLRIVEVGAGIGSMPLRLLRWGLLRQADYAAVDEQIENVAYALDWIPRWARDNGLQAEPDGENRLRLFDAGRQVRLAFAAADVFDYIDSCPEPADLLIAHAFLDLLPLPESLGPLFSLLKPGGLAWLTINFDGGTSFEPSLDPVLDEEIERLYHRTMDERPGGGDSRTGRHLFGHLKTAGAELLAAGPSDWVVHPAGAGYPADEAYFLEFILHFFEESLAARPELEPGVLAGWLAARRRQLERAELVYVAHQLDFLARKPSGA
jgi:SAM-dependent methyltransferase